MDGPSSLFRTDSMASIRQGAPTYLRFQRCGVGRPEGGMEGKGDGGYGSGRGGEGDDEVF